VKFPSIEIGSFRTRAVILAIVIALAPLGYVYLGPLYENIVQRRLQSSLREATGKTVDTIVEHASSDDDLPTRAFDRIAGEYEVWVRVTDHEGNILHAGNRALDDGTYGSMRRSISEDPSRLRLRDYDDKRPPLAERPEFQRASRKGQASRCELAQDGALLTCLEIRRVPPDGERGPMFVHLQNASVRGVRELAAARYPMFQLVVQLLGIGIVIALVVGWWSVRPVQLLREQVVDRASPPVSTNPVDVEAGGEVDRLADAFNDLLEALQERRQATKAYMADIAHEVKNPVAAIGTAAERLDADDPDPERIERIRRVLEDSSERLNRLVSRFLELARAEAGLPDEQRTTFDLGDLVDRLVEQFRNDERYTDLDIEWQGTSADIEAVPGHLETAVRNLLENGASFAEQRLVVELRTEPDRVILSVTDDGPGIADEDLPHVFDRFFSRRPGNEGTGLGLAMTRAVVEAHDGEIEVDSTLGERTTFEIHIPALVSSV
jgi:two-component system sensor histidine kinase ChvG